jgi:glycosyltransferase involved in cell wall biosynthesis
MNEMQPPKVSIIIPVYNGSDYLAEAVDSALNQTYKNLEIIVINDGSKDDGKTENIALRYKDKIRYFYKENGGVASALNFGIKKMEGKYFSWLSHDDLYIPEKVAKQVDLMESMKKDCIIFSDFEFIDSNTNTIGIKRILDFDPEKFVFYLINDHIFNGCTFLINKNLIEEAGAFNEALRTTQDYDLWFRLSRKYQYVHMPFPLIKSRIHGNQGTEVLKPIVIKEGNELYTKILAEIDDKEISRVMNKKNIGLFYIQCALGLLKKTKFLKEASQFSYKLYIKNIFMNSPAAFFKSFLLMISYLFFDKHPFAAFKSSVKRVIKKMAGMQGN